MLDWLNAYKIFTDLKLFYYRHFRLHLTSRKHLFTKDFRAVAVHLDSATLQNEDLPLETADFYEGYIESK